MTNERSPWREHWLNAAARLEALSESSLPGLSGLLKDATRPLTPLATQLIWFIQPMAGYPDSLRELAALLEESDEAPHANQ